MSNKPIFAFVLMPFADSFNDTYQLGIKAAAAKVGVEAQRLDEQIFNEGMLERIYRQIDMADIIIANMSGKNPNVFYEVGYAHAKEKICILLTDNASDIPFDLKQRRHIVYSTLTQLQEELIKTLEWAKTEVENIRKSQIQLIAQESGTLVTDDYRATGSVEFKVSMHNNSNRSSPDIESIYMYSGNDWRFTQDGNECPKTTSDFPPYKFCYFIKSPVSKIPPGSWAQFKVIGTRKLAEKWCGDEIKTRYDVSGHYVIRFMTNKGVFNYKNDLNLILEAMPF
ncbi:hypothetical protein SOV_09800 [Sporomusa ovata DSM 2662]|uniref:Uncharacterized protein n=1 Tax=Sporomusa ovata TaxID=2378 RepID=A0A0U1KXN7_9FIRM|nr:nucleoside 2-deoxyribosyltransferase domain containing protein [Sporomusa ovata]EQB28629.1 nucleoside 2-deoxyribosyltransferase domain containing protein [Sporomusa ovata DSM 2662]CQR72136.1 hypothetical protein SpAn4DRAFT_5025 [Sporomusa ovata]